MTCLIVSIVLSLVFWLMNRQLAGFSLSFQKSARRQGRDADRAPFRQHAAIVGDERNVYRCAQRGEFSIVGV